MSGRSPEEMEIAIIGAAKRMLHERFPDIGFATSWDHADALGERDVLLSNWNESGDAYAGAYFDRGDRYFAVALETNRIHHDGKWAVRVFRTAQGGGEGTREVEEELLVCDTIEDLVGGISRSLSAWRKPFLIHMSDDCSYFEALSPEDRRLLGSEGISVSNVVTEVMAESERHALEVFRGKGPRSRAFHDMVDRGIAELAPSAPPTP